MLQLLSITRRHFLAFLLLPGTLLLVVACQPGSEQNQKGDVIVSIPPFRYLVGKVSSNDPDIMVMVRDGYSPATYEPVPSQIRRITEASLFFEAGYLGYETAWRERFRELSPEVRFVQLSDGLDLISQAHWHDDHVHNGTDPHIWTGPEEVKVMAANIYRTLNSTFPSQPADTSLLAALYSRIDSLVLSHRQRMAPFRGRTVYIFHPAIGYYCREFELHQASIEHEGKEPSPAHLSELQDRMKADGIHGILVQKEFDKRHASTISKSLDLELITIDPLQENWFIMMDELAGAIERALGPVSEMQEQQ